MISRRRGTNEREAGGTKRTEDSEKRTAQVSRLLSRTSPYLHFFPVLPNSGLCDDIPLYPLCVPTHRLRNCFLPIFVFRQSILHIHLFFRYLVFLLFSEQLEECFNPYKRVIYSTYTLSFITCYCRAYSPSL